MNRRISIIVMNRDAEDAVLKNLPDDNESDETPTPDVSKMPQTPMPAGSRQN
jgi:chemotaxis protein MotB